MYKQTSLWRSHELKYLFSAKAGDKLDPLSLYDQEKGFYAHKQLLPYF